MYIVDRVGVSRGRHGNRSGWIGIGRYLVGSRSRSSRALELKVAGPCLVGIFGPNFGHFWPPIPHTGPRVPKQYNEA